MDTPEGSPRDIVVIGASAGGLEPLLQLASGLPSDLPSTLFVVLHIPPQVTSVLPELLSRVGPLFAAHAVDGETIRGGRIYVAPPDRHLLLESGYVRLSAGPRENHARPAADPLFRSAALAYGPRVVGMILSGALTDGTAGLWEIKQQGGVAIVQDPGEAAYPSMPHSAMDQVPVDHVLPVAEMPALLARLAEPHRTNADVGASESNTKDLPDPASSDSRTDVKLGSMAVELDIEAQVTGIRNGHIALYVCPECGGILWQVDADAFTRFRCHVGHVYGGGELLEGYTVNLERTMRDVVRSLRDKARLARQLATRARDQGSEPETAHYKETAHRDEEQSADIERMIATASDHRWEAS